MAPRRMCFQSLSRPNIHQDRRAFCLIGCAKYTCARSGRSARMSACWSVSERRLALCGSAGRRSVWVAVSLALWEPMGEGAGSIYEGGLAALVRLMRELCGPDWAPAEVLIPRREPADAGPYRSFFRAPIRFNAETTAVC